MSLLKKQVASPFSIPDRLLLYGHAGEGKTKILEGLKNAIIFDFENRSAHISGNVYNIANIAVDMNVSMVQAFSEAIKDLKNRCATEEKPDFIVIDTMSSFERDIVYPYATMKFNTTVIGKGMMQKGEVITDVVTQLSKGAGYQHLFLAYEAMIKSFNGLYNTALIMNCHIKQSARITDTEELSADDIYMTGKLRDTAVQTAQAVGKVFRDKETNKVYISFKQNNRTLVSKASAPYLHNKEILISEMDENGNFNYYWDSIFNPTV